MFLWVAVVEKQGYRVVGLCSWGRLYPVLKLSVAARSLGCAFLLWDLRYIFSSFFILPEKKAASWQCRVYSRIKNRKGLIVSGKPRLRPIEDQNTSF